MSTFSVFQDSPTRQTSSSFTFRSQTTLRLNEVAATPNHDKENVDPITCLGPTTINLKGKKGKRKYIREEGAGPLATKKKLKVSFAMDAISPVKKSDKKRRIQGGGNRLSAPRPLVRHDSTIIFDGLTDIANRRAVELTVSPLADASEAYLSVPGSAPQSPSPFVEAAVLLEVQLFSYPNRICSHIISGYFIACNHRIRIFFGLLHGVSSIYVQHSDSTQPVPSRP
jgi:hypothetical protein